MDPIHIQGGRIVKRKGQSNADQNNASTSSDVDMDIAASNQLLDQEAIGLTPPSPQRKKAQGKDQPSKNKALSSLHQASPVKGAPPKTQQLNLANAAQTTKIPVSEKTSQEATEDAEDADILGRLTELRRGTLEFCNDFFNFRIDVTPLELAGSAFINAPPELIRYVGYTAIGGPKGRQGWEELLVDKVLRKALVYGIISRVLKEHVLSSLCFGASTRLMEELEDMERQQVDEDGFARTKERAKKIRERSGDYMAPKGRELGIARITLQLEKLLYPIRELARDREGEHAFQARIKDFAPALKRLVVSAASLNLVMRLQGSVVYFFQPIFKDEEFDPRRMECLNLREMQESCPLQDINDKDEIIKANDPDGDPSNVALVRIICAYGCVAYRQGGGELGKRLLREEEGVPNPMLPPELQGTHLLHKPRDRKITAEDGFRTKTLAKGVVALRWGKPMYSEPQNYRKGYVELDDVKKRILREKKVVEEKTCCAM